MDFYCNPVDGINNNYIITYTNKLDEEKLTSGHANNKAHAEGLFWKYYGFHNEILKVQTSEEWIAETSTKIVKDLVKKFEEYEKVGSLVESPVI